MSDRPEPNPSGSTSRDVSSGVSPVASPPTGYSATRPASAIRRVTSPAAQGQGRPAGRFELPPLNPQHARSSETLPPPTSRIAGVSSILNPPHTDDLAQNRRRKASQLESPASSVQSLPSIAATTQRPQPTSGLPGYSPSLQYEAPLERPPRRILTPRSPSLHRAASLGQLNQSSGTISAQQNPFPASPHSRAYTIEPGTSGAPPLPTPPAINRSGYGFSGPNPSEVARRASGGTYRIRGLSSSASPSTSYSSYSQLEQTSPAAQYVATSNANPPTSQSTIGDPAFGASMPTTTTMGNLGLERQRTMGIPISASGGQNVYQMMTLETTSGTVQLPVDVQAASRVADEKRRRNAGASARFRQRRKEKEKEASTTIAKLEQQLKDLSEDADFYRRERDIFQGILSTIPGCERHLQRPPSPRLRRSSIPSLSGYTGSAFGAPLPPQEQVQRSPEGRNVRRRTSTFSLPPPPPPSTQQHQLSGSNAPYQPSFGPSPYGAPLAPQPPSLPPSGRQPPPTASMQHQQPPHAPPPVLQPTPQTGPWSSYPTERRPSGPSSRPRDER